VFGSKMLEIAIACSFKGRAAAQMRVSRVYRGVCRMAGREPRFWCAAALHRSNDVVVLARM
jgi:hypothetical protein